VFWNVSETGDAELVNPLTQPASSSVYVRVSALAPFTEEAVTVRCASP
jgi:hypothetical protein